MNLFTLDFETYYDAKYSLSSMSMEEYINDPRFEIIGLGLKANTGPTKWFDKNSGLDAVLTMLKRQAPTSAFLAHNAQFDGAILSWKYGIKPCVWFDTMAMSKMVKSGAKTASLKALSEWYDIGEKTDEVINAKGYNFENFTDRGLAKYKEYCINDVNLTRDLFTHICRDWNKSKDTISVKEQLLCISIIVKMFTEPSIEIDCGILSAYKDVLLKEQDKYTSFLKEYGYTPDTAVKMLRSSTAFAKALQYEGVDVKNLFGSTGKLRFSKGDPELHKLKEHKSEVVKKLVHARMKAMSSIRYTRSIGLINVANRNSGKFPIELKYMGARTARLSGGGKVNPQNLPRDGDIRKSLIPSKGNIFVVCDSSQIEARILALASSQMDLVKSFSKGEDVYSIFASKLFGMDVSKDTPTERFVGKCCVLGLGYGAGSVTLQKTLGLGNVGPKVVISDTEAKTYVNHYRNINSYIIALWKKYDRMLRELVLGNSGVVSSHPQVVIKYRVDNGVPELELPTGVKMYYPELRSSDNGFEYKPFKSRGFTSIYGSKLVENVVQSLAGTIITNQMAMIGYKYRIVLQVHDEVVVMCDESIVDKVKSHVSTVMKMPPSWAPDITLACEVGTGYSYGDAK